MSPKVKTRKSWSEGECNALLKAMKAGSYDEAIKNHAEKYKRTPGATVAKWNTLKAKQKEEKGAKAAEKKNGNGGYEVISFLESEYRIEFGGGKIKIFKR
jgi:hypothetical protein